MSAAGPPRLSLAVIVRNAAAELDATLGSVAAVVDEIVVLDTGSRDGTLDIARKYGAVVGQYKWHDDFSAARNACRERTTGDWVLWLDAGESISSSDAAALREFVRSAADPGRAYMLLVQTPPSTPHGAVEQVGRIRLMPRRQELRFVGRVGERIEPALAAAAMPIDGVPWRILRTAAEHDPRRKQAVAERNLRLAQRELADGVPPLHATLVLGESQAALGQRDDALRSLKQALQLAPRGSLEQLQTYYALLSTLDGDVDGIAAQTEWCLEALQSFPVDAQLLCAMGHYMQSQGRLELAARSFQLAFRHGQVQPRLWHLANIHEIAAACRAMVLLLQSATDEAVSWLEEALIRFPASLRLRKLLLQTHVQRGRRAEALAQVDLLPPHVVGRETLRTAVRGACLAAIGNWLAAESYLRTAYDSGCRDAICWRAYALSAWRNGRTVLARSLLEEWAAAEPHDAEPRALLTALVAGQSPPRTLLAERRAVSEPAAAVSSTMDTVRVVRIDGPTDAPTSVPAPTAWPTAPANSPPVHS